MIGERLPFVVAVRTTMKEFGGQPWRHVFLGDPLYTLKRESERNAPRLPSWTPTESWTSYVEAARPSTGTDSEFFLWTLKTSLARLQGKSANGTSGDDLVETLLSITRTRLPAEFKPIYDALLIDILLQAKKRSVLKARLSAIPEADKSPMVKRTIETLLAIDFNYATSRKDFAAARTVWRDVMTLPGALDLKKLSTTRVGYLTDTPVRRHDWITLLRASLKARPRTPEAEFLTTELNRVEEAARKDR
jgi:hypothetical protein